MRFTLTLMMLVVLLPVHANAYDIRKDIETCEKGRMTDCYSVGMALANGHENIKQNLRSAREYLSYACDGKIAKACYHLASIDRGIANTQEGLSDEQIDELLTNADALVVKACELKDKDACYQLGTYNSKKKDFVSAAKQMKQACLLGQPMGCLQLSQFYAAGKGLTKNTAKAKEYMDRFKAAAKVKR